MKFKIDIKQDKVIKRLNEIINKGGNIKPVLNKISLDMKKETQLRFEKKVDPDGNKWKELSPNTIATKLFLKKNGKLRKKPAKINLNASILTNSGRLRNSITNSIGSRYAMVSTNVKYAKTHQYGTKNVLIKPRTRRDKTKEKPYLRFFTANGFRIAKSVRVSVPKREFMGFSKGQIVRYKYWLYKYVFK